MSVPTGFPTGDDLIQFLLDERFLTETVKDSERYEAQMESVAEAFLVDIRRQNFIKDATPTARTFSFYGGRHIIPPFGIFVLTSATFDGDDYATTNLRLHNRNRYGAYMEVDGGSRLLEGEWVFTGLFGMVESMPPQTKDALLARGAANLYDGIEGTSSYTGSGDIKKIVQGPVTIEYDVGVRTSTSVREVDSMKMTYAKAVNEFKLRVC